MSSLSVQPGNHERHRGGCARLIPGDEPMPRVEERKPPRSVGMAAEVRVWPRRKRERLTEFMPGPLQGRMARRWARSMAADCALVALNWLLVGAALVPLRAAFPRVALFGYAAGAPNRVLGMALLHAALITLIGYTEGLHGAECDRGQQARLLGKSVLWATAVLWVAYGLQGSFWAAGILFWIAAALHFVALWEWRRWSARRGRTSAADELRNVLIVGSGGVARRVGTWIQQHPGDGRKLCGFLDDERPLGDGVVGKIADLARMARMQFVDEVILAAPRERSVTAQVLAEARRLRLDVEIVPELFGFHPVGQGSEQVGDFPVICLHAERLPAAGLALKRVMDVLGAGVILAASSVLLAVIAGLIKLDSRGPVFYAAPRAGRKGRRFRCYKFRTMVTNADRLKEQLRQTNERLGPCFKMADDPRITRVGRYLRRYSLDELPQLWNVLRGEMSLVGPRPHPLDDVAAYELEHLARMDVTPGMTGLWQVTARRDASFERGMELDREYIRTWSLGLDLRILLRTFAAVVYGSGE